MSLIKESSGPTAPASINNGTETKVCANGHGADLHNVTNEAFCKDRRVGIRWAAQALGCAVITLIRSEQNKEGLDFSVGKLGRTVSLIRLLQFGAERGIDVESRLTELRASRAESRGTLISVVEAQRRVRDSCENKPGLYTEISRASFIRYSGEKPIRVLSLQTFEQLVRRSKIEDPQTSSGLASLLELKDRDSIWVHVKTGRIKTEPRSIKKVRLDIDSVLAFVARNYPEKLQLVFSAAKVHGAFRKVPNLREEWAERVSIVRRILRGHICWTEEHVKKLLNKTALTFLPTPTRDRLGAIPFGETFIYPKIIISRDRLRIRSTKEKNPLMPAGARHFFGWSSSTLQHHIEKQHLKLKTYPTGERLLDPDKLRKFAADYLEGKADCAERLAKLERLIKQSLSPGQRIDQVLQKISALPPSEKLTRRQIDAYGAEIAKSLCTSNEIKLFIKSVEEVMRATAPLRAHTGSSSIEERQLDKLVYEIAVKKKQVLDCALYLKRRSEYDLSFLTQSDETMRAAKALKSRAAQGSEDAHQDRLDQSIRAPKPIRSDLPDKGPALVSNLRRAAILEQVAAEGEEAIVKRDIASLDRVTERYVTPVIRHIVGATAQTSIKEIAKRLVKKGISPVLPETFDRSSDAALFYFDADVVGPEQAFANLEKYVSRYQNLDQVVCDRFLAAALGTDRSITAICQALIKPHPISQRPLMPWQLPEGHSIVQRAGKKCRYLDPEVMEDNSEVMEDNSRVIANAHLHIKRSFLSLDDFDIVKRGAEIRTLCQALEFGDSPKKLACYSAQKELVSPYLKPGQQISLHARHSYFVDVDVVGDKILLINLHTWFNTQLKAGREFPFPKFTTSAWHRLFDIVGLQKPEAMKVLRERGFYSK